MKSIFNKEKIRELREAQLWTQANLGFRLKRTRLAVWNYEHGICLPGIETLCKMATLFNVPVKEFFKEIEE